MKLENLADLLKVISHPPRLRLLVLLNELDRELCVCELVDALSLPQYQVSRQLSELREEDLVKGSKEGTWVYYSLSENLRPSIKRLIEDIADTVEREEIKGDIRQIEERLERREDGKCVVGYEENDE